MWANSKNPSVGGFVYEWDAIKHCTELLQSDTDPTRSLSNCHAFCNELPGAVRGVLPTQMYLHGDTGLDNPITLQQIKHIFAQIKGKSSWPCRVLVEPQAWNHATFDAILLEVHIESTQTPQKKLSVELCFLQMTISRSHKASLDPLKTVCNLVVQEGVDIASVALLAVVPFPDTQYFKFPRHIMNQTIAGLPLVVGCVQVLPPEWQNTSVAAANYNRELNDRAVTRQDLVDLLDIAEVETSGTTSVLLLRHNARVRRQNMQAGRAAKKPRS